MNFTKLDNGKVDGFVLVKSVETKTSAKGDIYLDFTLGDKTGEINAKLWQYSKLEYGEYEPNDIIKVRGTISVFNGADQLRIEKIRKVSENDNIGVEDLVKTAEYSSEEMYDTLMNIADRIEDAEIKNLVKSIYADNREKLMYWPAAYKLHHAMRGGLLLHTLSIVKLCERVCDIYSFIDKDLLIAGAMLHDISKIEEYISTDTGMASGYSIKGNLLGHLTMGAAKIGKYAEKLGVSDEKAMLLEHMILSHHGVPEYGAAVRPMFIEAELLSELDLFDSRLYEMRDALMGVEKDEFSHPVWALDNRKLFNHGRVDLNGPTKLI